MASSFPPDPRPAVVVHGGAACLPTLLGQGTPRLPTGGKIRAGIKVLTPRAAELPQAQAIYEQGLAQGQSFEQIERTLVHVGAGANLSDFGRSGNVVQLCALRLART